MILLLLKCPQNSKNFHAYGTQPHIMAILHASYVATYGTAQMQLHTHVYQTCELKIVTRE